MYTDESLDTLAWDDEPVQVVSDMSDWVEYGDDIIDAGPASFPNDEYYPSQQDLLQAQAMVQTVNPLDLLLNRPVLAESLQMGMDTTSEATYSLQDNTTDASFDFDYSTQLDFGSYEPTPYFGPIPSQVSSTSQNAFCELDDDEMDQNADLLSIGLPGSIPVSIDEPTGQVTLVDADGEEYDAWYFEAILDSRRVANCKGGIEYLVRYTGYSPSWQPARDLRDNLYETMDFHAQMPGKAGPPPPSGFLERLLSDVWNIRIQDPDALARIKQR